MDLEFLAVLLAFALIFLASRDVGLFSRRFGLPLISGFIFTGVLVGPYVLEFIKADQLHFVNLIDAVALPFIAFTAGAELHIDEIRRRARAIASILISLIVVLMVAGFTAFLVISGSLPFMADMKREQLVAASLLGASILVAKSPSSVVAIIKELRARGPFVQTAMGVTVLMDAVVIVLFAFCAGVADVLLTSSSFDLVLLVTLVLEIVLNCACGVLIAGVLRLFVVLPINERIKSILILICGLSVSYLTFRFQHLHLPGTEIGFFTEPLLICMVAGLVVSNFTRASREFEKLLADSGPIVFTIFFTGLGVSLNLDVLEESWLAAVVLVAVRFIAANLGCFIGATLAGYSPPRHRALFGLAFITQAGISVSLAKEIGILFPGWGGQLSTLLLGMIIINTLVGPAFTRMGIIIAGEAHLPTAAAEEKRDRTALIFGVEDQALALYQELLSHGWQVTLVDIDAERVRSLQREGIVPKFVEQISAESLKSVGADKVDTIVCMLDDDMNYKICEVAYEHFGTDHLLARSLEGSDPTRFHEIGVTVVNPIGAVVRLLDHYVRSPLAASLLLGAEENKDVIEIEVNNPAVHGMALRDLHFPSDTLILAVRRRGQMLLSHGYTRLRLGDQVTIVGSTESLELVRARIG
ncbi:MAG: potassium transporter TrkA [Candidatus Dadabacteria bacterium]|nr:MAG: potassium transporter TrkA [Candidatus Dadabacteria bacterium]